MNSRPESGVTLAGTDLSAFAIADVRRHIMVSDTSALLFQGTLQRNVDPRGTATREQAEDALRAACAEDVCNGAVPAGMRSCIVSPGDVTCPAGPFSDKAAVVGPSATLACDPCSQCNVTGTCGSDGCRTSGKCGLPHLA